MAKTPVKANAPTAKTAPKMGAAPAPKPAAATPADAANKPTDPATADAAGLNDRGAADGVPATATTAEVEAAYKEGYSNGFSAALDEQAEERGAAPDDDLAKFDAGTAAAQSFSGGDDYMRSRLVTLALFTPENQRKGGLHVVVARLESFVSGLPEEDRDSAMMFMSAIAQTSPLDLATGRFKLLVIEGLGIIAGTNGANLPGEATAESGEAAASRLSAAMPDLDETPEELTEEQDRYAGVDMSNPDSPHSAAARLGML